VNERFSEITGRAAAELVGRESDAVVHPADIESVRRQVAELLAGHRERTGSEWRCVRPDGTMAWIRSDLGMIYGSDGKAAHLVAVVADVTASHAAHEVASAAVAEIQERMEEWSATVDALPLGLVVLDPQCRVLRANRIALDLAAEVRSEPAAESWLVSDLVPVEPWKAIVGLATSSADMPSSVEVVDGVGRTFLVSLARTAQKARARGRTLVTFADVTEMARLKERLEHSERLALMGSLMSGVAHEVRNPLFAISANADALDLELGRREDVGEMLEALREGVSRLRRVLEDLLDFGRSSPAAPATGALDLAVLRGLRACDELSRGAGVTVSNRVPQGLMVAMDERRLARALESVLGNAFLWARSFVQIDVDDSPESGGVAGLRLTVRDDGPGFAPEDLPRVFEPFFSRRRGAVGLGLTIAQRILDQYCGSIAASNHEEGGALVTLSLPLPP
jgi:PAS domain S-box-containing protein